MNRVIHFELGAVDPTRAVEFYKSVFGWEAQRYGTEEYWLMKTGTQPEPGIDGAVLRNKDSQPRTVNSIAVDSVDDAARKIEEHGGQVVVPKRTIPGVGHVVYCKDTEGNIFGIFHSDHT
jgi:predicted enzyme related to lactoylglutathione lyase